MMQHLLMSTNGSAAEHYFHGSNIWWTCKGGDFMTPGWKNVCTWVPKTLRTGRRRFQKRSKRGKRSEEHTSELQSRLHLVCRLLLEKKKKRKYQTPYKYYRDV